MPIQQDSKTDMIVLEGKNLRVIVDPIAGGKIRSLFSKRTGIEYLYQDPRQNFTPGPSYGSHDLSGFDECFPTVWPCSYPDGKRQGLELGDHGWLWQQPWKAEVADGQVIMRCEIAQLNCEFQRTCRLSSDDGLTLDYRITNHDEEPLKFIYSAHPLLAAGPDTQLMLPDEVEEVFVFFVANATGIPESSWIAWPPPDNADLLAPYSASRKSCFKGYTRRLKTGRASVRHADRGERLQFEFNSEDLPHLGFLMSQGFDEDPHGSFAGELFLALEPTTGVGDDLPTCEQTRTTATLEPGETKPFTIQLSLVDEQ